jgi:nucleoside-diphosphate kinase
MDVEPGTILGDMAVNIGRNVICGSDAPVPAAFDISPWFTPEKLNNWSPYDQSLQVES